MSGYHLVVYGTGNPRATGGVFLLPRREMDRYLDPGLDPSLGTGAPLAFALPDHVAYSCTTLTALLARLAALRLP